MLYRETCALSVCVCLCRGVKELSLLYLLARWSGKVSLSMYVAFKSKDVI